MKDKSVFIMEEAGVIPALYGLGLSHGKTTDAVPSWESVCEMEKVADKLAHKGGGHNKFLESIDVWLLVDESRYFWSEADTYRLTTKQSESTMHNQKQRFETFEPETLEEEDLLEQLKLLQDMSERFFQNARTNASTAKKGIKLAKMGVVESLKQKRVWKVSYMTLQNIIRQRKGHRLDNWQEFCKSVLAQVEYPEWLIEGGKL